MERVSQDEEQSEFSIVVKEITSLQRERRELLASLTPGLSIWKRREENLLTRFAGKDYTSAAPVQELELETETEPASTEEQQLGMYLDSTLQDMEDLSHRMLSTAYLVAAKPDGAALSSYMADELASSTSRLMDACKELLHRDTEDNDEQPVEKNAFLDFYHEFLKEPLDYQNELALVATKEEEEDWEKEVEKERKRAEEVHKENMAKWTRWKEQQKYAKEKKMLMEGKGSTFMEKEQQKEKERKDKEKEDREKYQKENPEPDTMEFLNKGMEVSVKFFADHRDGWNSVWGSKSTGCGDLRDITTLSPMQFTHYTPDTIPSSCGVTGSSLQIYSIEILELKKGLKWPVKLYGVVAARDTVDRNRNILFSRSSSNCQELSENGSLCLTGPSRAIIAMDYVDFEVQLKLKDGKGSQDKEMITLSKRYDGTGTSLILEGSLCKAVLRLEKLSRAVQATIVGVCVVEGKWPFEYGCRVACSMAATADEVVLLDCRAGDGDVRVGSNDYLHLSRNVVSVQSQATLRVVIQSYLKSGRAAQNWNFDFPAQQCQTSERECSVGTTKVKVVIAWSLLVKEKRDLLVNCPAVQIQRARGSLKEMKSDSEETTLAKFGDEIPRLDRDLLDTLCRHREILRRETDFLQGEVTSRRFATFAGKKAYMETQSNGRTISPPLLSELFALRRIQSVGVNLPHLVTHPQESLVLLLHESDHLRYRIQSLVSILREFGIPDSSVDDNAKKLLLLMARAAAIISETMRSYSEEGARRLHQTNWDSIWGSGKAGHGVFEDITTLSPMLFTPITPGIPPYSATICPALQIYSMKIVRLNPNLNWPLRVYGIVAARDTMDHNRNLLFYRSRANYQLVTEDDPFLRLTGPSRAIVADSNPVTFEVELKINYSGAEGRQDTAFFYETYNWRSMRDTTPLFRGYACEAKLNLEVLPRAIQATIVGVRLVGGSWPSAYGCRVSCSVSSAAEDDREVELLNCSSLDDVKKSPVGSDGYFGLTRNVVSAELQSTLTVFIQAIGGAYSHVEFHVEQYCQTSKASCFVVGCEVEVVVAWSLLVKEKLDLML